MFYLLKRLKQK